MNYVSRAAQAKLLGLYPELEFEVNGNDVVLKNYNGVFKNYTVPDFITIIADGCFVDCPSLESIVIPASVKRIGDCFHHCINLKTIDMPDDIDVDDFCFYHCDV